MKMICSIKNISLKTKAKPISTVKQVPSLPYLSSISHSNKELSRVHAHTHPILQRRNIPKASQLQPAKWTFDLFLVSSPELTQKLYLKKNQSLHYCIVIFKKDEPSQSPVRELQNGGNSINKERTAIKKEKQYNHAGRDST